MPDLLADSTAASAGRTLELIVRGGTVIDGTGRPAMRADIGISAGVIAEIGDLSSVSAVDEIDAAGLVVTPGLVDVHSHSDLTLLVDGRAQSALSQGVTTELVGNCGHGCTPLRDRPEFAAAIFGYNRSIPLDWRTTAEYLDKLRSARPAVNVGTLVPLGNLRLSTMDDPEIVASSDQVQHMRALLEEALEQGALGMSCGLQYPDSVATRPEELDELAKSVAERDGLYAACVRYTDERAVEGIEEPIGTAAKTGVRTQISHAMPMPGSPPGMTAKTFELVDNGRSSGLDVAFDMHTRSWGEVNLSAMLPLWVLVGSRDEIDARLASKAEREKIKQYPSYIRRFVDNPGPDEMMVVLTQDTSLTGRTLSELTPAGADPLDTIMDILRSEQENMHRPLVLIRMYPEDDLASFYQHPECSVASDATTLSVDGPLRDAVFYGAFTWASWFLKTIVRERKALDLPEAIRKVTSLPASRIGLKDRGVLRKGACADVAMFNLSEVTDTGTLLSPNELARGTVNVIVNGVVSWRDGHPRDVRGGTVLTSG
ncbi:MAG: amidohydrolase family protein [Acidimicrobiales bacterium]|jgi:N-acyl-D-aspartate/D-glutamate deacylase